MGCAPGITIAQLHMGKIRSFIKNAALLLCRLLLYARPVEIGMGSKRILILKRIGQNVLLLVRHVAACLLGHCI